MKFIVLNNADYSRENNSITSPYHQTNAAVIQASSGIGVLTAFVGSFGIDHHYEKNENVSYILILFNNISLL